MRLSDMSRKEGRKWQSLLLRMGDCSMGTLNTRAGACPDILVVNGDPLQDVSILAEPTANISLIMAAGSIVKNILPA
jgi:hypothetical protein